MDRALKTGSNRPFAQLWPGNEVRGIAGENRLHCVCFSFELSFFFCFWMSFSDHCCFPRFSNQGRASPSLFSHGFHGQVSSGSAGYLPFVRLTGRTSASRTARSYALSTSSLRKIFAFMLVPKSMWTLPSPVLWNRVRLDTSRKHVQCHRCFLFARRMGPKWEYGARTV